MAKHMISAKWSQNNKNIDMEVSDTGLAHIRIKVKMHLFKHFIE